MKTNKQIISIITALGLLFLSLLQSKQILTTDHIISMDNTDFGKDVDNTCNFSLNVEQEGIRKGRAEGRAEGREEGIKILIDSLRAANMIRDAVKNMVKEGYSMTEAEINKYMDIYWPA